jgi:catalase
MWTPNLLISASLPAFFARTPEEFLAFVAARVPYATTGQPDMAKLQAFFASHPQAASVVQWLQRQPALVSFAQVSY